MARILKPLDGTLVLEFGQFISAPGATLLLADLGADVIKIEPISGELARSSGDFGQILFRNFNRNKRSIAVDLRTDEGREVALRLAARADVALQNMRPGAMNRLGLGSSALRERNPHLVYASLSGYGDDDLEAGRPAFDVAVQAEAGLMSITGPADRPPSRAGFAVVDVGASCMLALAVLAALQGRGKPGTPLDVRVSMFEVGMHLASLQWAEYFTSGVEPRRNGNSYPTAAPSSELLKTADGEIVLSAYAPPHWRSLCATLGRLDLIDDPRFATNDARVAHRAEMLSELGKEVSGRSTTELLKTLADAGIVAGAVNSFSRVRSSKEVEDLGLIRTVDDPSGPYETVRTPIRLLKGGEQVVDDLQPPPALGEHGDAILAELGYDSAAIQGLHEGGVVGGTPRQ
jgi:crotonobetainyl-CoA:carnitine CoA-transferase CaiB-like acyl-CoA transferase